MIGRGAYYNEFDPFAAAWLRELIKAGEIAPGDVDERSIKEVQPDDLRGYVQCHFFAGIGGWSAAARIAGWEDDRPLWTGSCPCQPFSVAGKGAGVDDARHLWPDYFRLVSACRPPVVMGEQVAGKAGYGWLDGVLADLAGEGYAGRGVDIPACAVDAPHIRSRLYWVARSGVGLADAKSSCGRARLCENDAQRHGPEFADRDGRRELLAQPRSERSCGRSGEPGGDIAHGDAAGRDEGAGGSAQCDEAGIALGDAQRAGLERHAGDVADGGGRSQPGGSATPADGGLRNGTFWTGADWLACHDGKARRTQPGSPLLAHGIPKRVAKWRGFGNAIVPQLAAEVIAAVLDVEMDEALADEFFA